MSLYAKFMLWLIRPALEAYEEERKPKAVVRDIRRRVKSGELHL